MTRRERAAGGSAGALLLVLLLASGCSPRTDQDAQARIAQLESEVDELEQRLNQAWVDMSRLSTEMSANVQNLATAVGEIERRVLDIRTDDLQFTVPEVEAAVAVTRQRLSEVQRTTAEFQRAVSP
jgi:outer membrane murein-binding lipoprotein Lpp